MYKSDEIARMILQVLRRPESVGSANDPQQASAILNELASDYSEACKRVNEQLRHAMEYANVGNTGEAIRFIELFHVREDYENLTLGTQQELWKLFCQEYGLTIPVPLDDDLYNDTTYLYQSYEPIKATLSKFRLLCLEKGPLKERLALLRQLAAQDVGNSIWDEMIVNFEKTRIEEIEAEFRALPKTKASFSAASELLNELSLMTESGNNAPESIARTIREFTDSVKHEKQVDVLQSTVNKMLDAYRKKNRPDVERYMADWLRFTGQMQPNKIPPLLIEDVKGPLEWLNQLYTQDTLEQEFNEKLDSLRQSFRDGSTLEEIIDAHGVAERAAENCGKAIPDSDEKTFKLCVRALNSQRNRKLFYKFSLTTLIFTLFTGVIGWGIYTSHTRKTIRDIEQQLSALMDNYEGKSEVSGDDGSQKNEVSDPDTLLKQAEDLAKGLQAESPRITRATAVKQQLSRLEGLVEASNIFKHARDDAEQILDNGDGLSRNQLEQLERFCKTKHDRETFSNLKERNNSNISKKIEAAKEARNKEYKGFLDDTKKKLAALENTPLAEKEELITQIKANLSNLQSIEESGTVDGKLTEEAKNYTQTCVELERKFNAATDLEKITDVIGDDPKSVDTFLEAIQQFASKYPDDLIASRVETIRKCCSGYQDVILWNNFVAKVGRSPADWEDTSEFESNFDKIKDRVLFIPDSRKVSDLFPMVKAIRGIGGRAVLAKELKQCLEPCDEECWVWRRYEGDNDLFYYYLTQKPDLSNTGEYMYLATRKNPGKTAPLSPSFTKEEIDRIVLAPHCQIARTLLDRLNDSKNNIENPVGWCETMIDLLNQLDPEEENKVFDFTVKASLLYAVICVLKEDPIFADKLLPWQKIFEDDPEFSPDVDWLNPENKELARQRKVAARIFDKLKTKQVSLPFQTFRDRAAKEADTKVSTYPWVGLLINESGTWKVMFKKGITISGDLVMAAPKSSDSAPGLVKVGTAEENNVTFSGDAQNFFVGAPILVRVTDDSDESPR